MSDNPNIKEINSKEEFQSEVMESDVPVLVDFWAEWCGPCKAMAPHIDELASETSGKLKVVKVDTDANRDLSMEHQIMSIPTTMIVQGGEIKTKVPGFRPKDALVQLLNDNGINVG